MFFLTAVVNWSCLWILVSILVTSTFFFVPPPPPWHLLLKGLTESCWFFGSVYDLFCFDSTFQFMKIPTSQAPAELLVSVLSVLQVHSVSCLNIIKPTGGWQEASGSQTFPVDSCQVVYYISSLKWIILR